MDMNREVFAFRNQLFDLNSCVFRSIQPSDYVSTTTGYDAPIKSNTTVRGEVDSFLNGLFEDAETTAYWKHVLAYAMLGYNKFEEFYTMTGNGGNGKGVCFDLLKTVFGDYFYSANITLFTKPMERADQPIPALVEARAKRIVITTEPEADDRLQVSLLKKLTGGDLVEARTLHSRNIIKYKPQFSLFFQTNDIPKLSKIDGGIQRRMRVVRFPFQFVGNPTMPHERQGDPDVKNKKCVSDLWRDEVMLMLCEVWRSIKGWKTLEAPAKVKQATEDYIDDNNPLKSWLTKYYTITNQESDMIRASVLKQDYMTDCRVEKIADVRFKQLMKFNNIESKKTKTSNVFCGLIRKTDEEIDVTEAE
jgi:putative DNA primase/helicase